MNIARLNAMMTATAGPFVAGMKAGEKAVSHFGGVFGGVAGKVAGAAAVIGVSLSAASAVSFINSHIEAIDNLDDAAAAIGMTTDSLSRLQYATSFAGIENDTLNASIGKMLKNLGGIDEDAGPAALALARIGLSVGELKNLAPEEAFGRVADGIAGVGNASDQNSIAVAIFGKAGSALIPVLNNGSAALQEMYEKSDLLNYTVRQTDASRVAEAADAIQDVGYVFDGVGRAVAIGLAPYITAAANEFVTMGMNGEKTASAVLTGIEWIATGIAYASNAVDVLTGSWYALQSGLQWIIVGILESINAVGEGVVDLINLIPGVEVEWAGLGDTIAMYADAAKENWAATGEAFGSAYEGKNIRAVEDFFASVRAGSSAATDAAEGVPNAINTAGAAAIANAKQIADTIGKLQTQVDQFGMTDSQKVGVELQAAGASPEQIAEATALQDRLTAMEEEKKQIDDNASAAKSYYESTRTEAEKYAAEIERINALQEAGALDADTADRARAAAEEQLEESTKGKKAGDVGGPQFMEAGSAAAASFIAQAQRAEDGDDENKQIAKNTRESSRSLKTIADAVTKPGNSGFEVIDSI